MKLAILSFDDFIAKTRPFDHDLPEGEQPFYLTGELDLAETALRAHLARLDSEHGLDPVHSGGGAWTVATGPLNRVIRAFLYADSLYTPDLLPGVVACLPKDRQPWCAELNFMTDAFNPRVDGELGWAAIIDGTFYTAADKETVMAYAPRLGLEVT